MQGCMYSGIGSTGAQGAGAPPYLKLPYLLVVSRADVGGRERLVTIAAIPWTTARMLAVPIRFVHVIVGG